MAYAKLSTLLRGSERDICLDLSPHVPPSLVTLELRSAAEDLEDLPPLPDTPLGLSKFGLLSQESFDKAIRDLIQEEPDFPIGGHKAAPMKRSFNVGSLAIKAADNSREYMDTPRIEISSPKATDCAEFSITKPLKDRSNFSEPFYNAVVAEDQAPHSNSPSVSSMALVTAPESPVGIRSRIQSELSDNLYDGKDLSGTIVRDFAHELESPISPCSQLKSSTIPGPPGEDSLVLLSNSFDGQAMTRLGLQKSLPSTGLDNVQSTTLGVASLPLVPGVPTDGTGQLPLPGTPPSKASKNSKKKGKGKMIVRKGRTIVCNKAVLSIVLGRQLAEPTFQALKLLSKDIPVDVTELKDAAPVPAPVPTPV